MSINAVLLAMRLLRHSDLLSQVNDWLSQKEPDQPPPPPDTNPVFPVGSVEWLQDSLNQLIDAELEVDGEYGPATKDAITDYQTMHELKVDGWAGPETVNSIIEELEKPAT
jgi:peptidoglycan hydrolase-like protein with peptidoglycan-binding domain